MATSVLIVEDEPEIREMLNFSLTRAGFTVIEAATGEMALQRLDTNLPDILIVDWMLPGMSGVELAKRIRRDELTSALPLLMLTARSEETDVLKSFESGIDDYMSKPFSPKELVARIKALLRRSGAPENDVLEASGIRIDLVSHRLTIEGKNINIGPTEYRLLELLMRNPDRVFERDQLLDRVWGRSSYIETRTVDVHVLRLRKVLKPFGLDGTVQTVRSVGYRFTPIQ
ncbi:MAG: phosphate regulon transcriptional regulatory protein PhoB [Gammaproteobacteria bacterium TMED243]|nr:phosphate regulon transcriptional regulatory protein PhoB [Gammaproteobacteria bacterium]RPG33077.1 MAG: phosphate regulon transcriptional regulatory protein PhoB [Gammaproteobacteria bacterium TMED243]